MDCYYPQTSCVSTTSGCPRPCPTPCLPCPPQPCIPAYKEAWWSASNNTVQVVSTPSGSTLITGPVISGSEFKQYGSYYIRFTPVTAGQGTAVTFASQCFPANVQVNFTVNYACSDASLINFQLRMGSSVVRESGNITTGPTQNATFSGSWVLPSVPNGSTLDFAFTLGDGDVDINSWSVSYHTIA